jgi:AcrR family transcriptional regulator
MPQRGRRQADDMILMALACGATLEAAAAKAGVSKTTVQRRLQDPEFKARLQEIRSDMVKRNASTLTAASGEAIKTLLSLQQPTSPPAVRLGAARSVLEIGIKMREIADVEERLAALEQQMTMNNPP